MPLIDGKKFACATCIKGHRSSSCNHVDRPLTEILPKGRPPTQCAHCRELRRTSKVHSKCTCGDRSSKSVAPGRKKPPKGLVIPPQSPQAPASRRLKTCSCPEDGVCICGPSASGSDSQSPLTDGNVGPSKPSCCSSRPTPSNVSNPFGNLLEAAAWMEGSGAPSPAPLPISSHLASQSSLTTAFTSPPPINTSTSITPSGTSAPPLSPNSISALFAPSTAGTASCFCGPSCPCAGCVVHDPHGLKFRTPLAPTTTSTLPPLQGCPTGRTPAGAACLGGMDLPTIEELLQTGPGDSAQAAMRPGAEGTTGHRLGEGCSCCGESCSCTTCACSGHSYAVERTLHGPTAARRDEWTPPRDVSMEAQCTVPSCGMVLE